ncbi:hypothetical protein LX36DRAFT_753809 [Colletotrichum falcatum]|nr:hypothetical protein LX36DRAFT_753809 [Colletotrichum falcatum]
MAPNTTRPPARACRPIGADPYAHLEDPVEMLSPVYQGLTCLPPSIHDSGNCTMGGFPRYVINATWPEHVQEGVRLAKETGVRLAGVEYVQEVVDAAEGYSGPAFKCGAGVQAFEIYKVASEHNKVVVDGGSHGRATSGFNIKATSPERP